MIILACRPGGDELVDRLFNVQTGPKGAAPRTRHLSFTPSVTRHILERWTTVLSGQKPLGIQAHDLRFVNGFRDLSRVNGIQVQWYSRNGLEGAMSRPAVGPVLGYPSSPPQAFRDPVL